MRNKLKEAIHDTKCFEYVKRRLEDISQKKFNENDVVAGQAVASVIIEYLAKDFEHLNKIKTPINDIDVFHSVDISQDDIIFTYEKNELMQKMISRNSLMHLSFEENMVISPRTEVICSRLTATNFSGKDIFEITKSYENKKNNGSVHSGSSGILKEEGYGDIGFRHVHTGLLYYSSVSDGMLQHSYYTSIIEKSAKYSEFDFMLMLVSSFDINATQVGFIPSHNKIWFTEYFLDFLNFSKLEIINYRTPIRSLYRLFEKKEQMGDVYIDRNSETMRCLAASRADIGIHALQQTLQESYSLLSKKNNEDETVIMLQDLVRQYNRFRYTTGNLMSYKIKGSKGIALCKKYFSNMPEIVLDENVSKNAIYVYTNTDRYTEMFLDELEKSGYYLLFGTEADSVKETVETFYRCQVGDRLIQNMEEIIQKREKVNPNELIEKWCVNNYSMAIDNSYFINEVARTKKSVLKEVKLEKIIKNETASESGLIASMVFKILFNVLQKKRISEGIIPTRHIANILKDEKPSSINHLIKVLSKLYKKNHNIPDFLLIEIADSLEEIVDIIETILTLDKEGGMAIGILETQTQRIYNEYRKAKQQKQISFMSLLKKEIVEYEKMIKKPLVKKEDRIETFKTEHYIVKELISVYDLKKEGREQKHCVSGYGQHIKTGNKILSIIPVNKEKKQITMDLIFDNKEKCFMPVQLKLKKNRIPIVDRDVAMVLVELAKRIDLKLKIDPRYDFQEVTEEAKNVIMENRNLFKNENIFDSTPNSTPREEEIVIPTELILDNIDENDNPLIMGMDIPF